MESAIVNLTKEIKPITFVSGHLSHTLSYILNRQIEHGIGLLVLERICNQSFVITKVKTSHSSLGAKVYGVLYSNGGGGDNSHERKRVEMEISGKKVYGGKWKIAGRAFEPTKHGYEDYMSSCTITK